MPNEAARQRQEVATPSGLAMTSVFSSSQLCLFFSVVSMATCGLRLPRSESESGTFDSQYRVLQPGQVNLFDGQTPVLLLGKLLRVFQATYTEGCLKCAVKCFD